MVLQKPRGGRPKTGQDPVVTVRLPPLLVQQIDDWAEMYGVTRSDAIRGALEALVKLGGLEPEPDEKLKPVRVAKSGPAKRPRGWDANGDPIY